MHGVGERGTGGGLLERALVLSIVPSLLGVLSLDLSIISLGLNTVGLGLGLSGGGRLLIATLGGGLRGISGGGLGAQFFLGGHAGWLHG